MEGKENTPHSSDRRQFFRINDKVIVDYRLLASEEANKVAKIIANLGHDEDDHEQSVAACR